MEPPTHALILSKELINNQWEMAVPTLDLHHMVASYWLNQERNLVACV